LHEVRVGFHGAEGGGVGPGFVFEGGKLPALAKCGGGLPIGRRDYQRGGFEAERCGDDFGGEDFAVGDLLGGDGAGSGDDTAASDGFDGQGVGAGAQERGDIGVEDVEADGGGNV
jgi:hypothetical protein